MKTVKGYNQFVNEELYKEIDMELPIRDDKYKFLIDITKKCGFEQTNHFYVKDLIEIGTCGSHKLYLNYLDVNEYDNRLSYWVVYNEQPDDLYGTSWDSGVIWEEDGKLKFTEKHDFTLFPDFIDIIYNEIKTYTDLDKWCEQLKEMGIKSRYYHRHAIQSSDHRMKPKGHKKPKELTWDEQLDWTKNRLEHDKLLNRHSKPTEEKDLEEMLKMGEVEYGKRAEEINKIASSALKELLDEEKGKDK
jgi:hypothetical protein